MQTASVIAERLGVKVLLDYGLAEVFGPELFGETPLKGGAVDSANSISSTKKQKNAKSDINSRPRSYLDK